jgi:hypothetical protein
MAIYPPPAYLLLPRLDVGAQTGVTELSMNCNTHSPGDVYSVRSQHLRHLPTSSVREAAEMPAVLVNSFCRPYDTQRVQTELVAETQLPGI